MTFKDVTKDVGVVGFRYSMVNFTNGVHLTGESMGNTKCHRSVRNTFLK